MSAELMPTPEVKSIKDKIEDLRERYVSTPMEAGVGYIIPPLESIENAMGTCGSPEDGLDQYLLGLVVAANKDIFAFVDVSGIFKLDEKDRPRMMLKTAVTHHIPGKRGDFVCFIENNNVPKSVGRSGVGKFDPHTSSKHFSISQDTDGTLIVTDLSLNGSELLTPVVGSKFGLKEGINHHTDTNNPLEDFDFWSVKSASMRDEFEKTIQIER